MPKPASSGLIVVSSTALVSCGRAAAFDSGEGVAIAFGPRFNGDGEEKAAVEGMAGDRAFGRAFDRRCHRGSPGSSI